MRLTELTDGLGAAAGDLEIAGLTADSRQVRPGFLFAALPGTKIDGRSFVPEALRRGAVAVLAPQGYAIGTENILVVPDANPRRRLALMAARFFAGQPRHLVAVTGTNGKTSTVDFLRQIWTLLDRRCASIGTLGVIAPIPGAGFLNAPSMTTPDPVALHEMLRNLATSGFDHLALEASSHGLDQHRLDGVRVTSAGFTNLTRDHLDYHGDMATYLAAKQRLFDSVLAPGGTAVLNADSPEFAALAQICAEHGHPVVGYGHKGRELRLIAANPVATGLDLTLEIFGRRMDDVRVPLAGPFQAANLLCALGLLLAEGEDADSVVATFARLRGVPGRMELVGTRNNAPIYVDYAHTPDALETVLSALRPHCRGRLVVVFGCGGDRDAGKRPLMGAIAGRLADAAIVTDDNPRGENAAAIRTQVLAGYPDGASFSEIGDRAKAIHVGLSMLRPEDILVIAGKGHEHGQIIGSTVHPFDDGDVVRAILAEQGGARS